MLLQRSSNKTGPNVVLVNNLFWFSTHDLGKASDRRSIEFLVY